MQSEMWQLFIVQFLIGCQKYTSSETTSWKFYNPSENQQIPKPDTESLISSDTVSAERCYGRNRIIFEDEASVTEKETENPRKLTNALETHAHVQHSDSSGSEHPHSPAQLGGSLTPEYAQAQPHIWDSSTANEYVHAQTNRWDSSTPIANAHAPFWDSSTPTANAHAPFWDSSTPSAPSSVTAMALLNAIKAKIASDINNTESRIVPFAVKATQNRRQKYPTIRLGEIVQKLIFPDWIWKGSGISHKMGAAGNGPGNGANKSTNSAVASGVPITLLKLPTITFDNNYSRFLKLFTMVKFNNTQCIGLSGLVGTCYHAAECSSLGGAGTSACAGGLGVCCIFTYTCGAISQQNATYFVDGGATYSATGAGTCSIEIVKINSLVNRLRLDFEIFSLQQPTAGNCDTDRFVVSGQNINNVIPILCGDNNGTHIFIETWGPGNVQLSVMTRGSGFRKWRIKVTQSDLRTLASSPSYCLQHKRGVVGTLNSFNYNSYTTPQYLNNLNYAICIQKAPGFCSITFTNGGLNGTYKPFQIVNANENGDLVIPSGQAGIGVRDCPFDYVLINGNRLCGDRFNDGVSSTFPLVDAPVTDFSNGPFIVTVRTNELDVGGGFYLFYRQNPCMPMITLG